MGSVLHSSARTTPRVRAELQASEESTRAVAAVWAESEDREQVATSYHDCRCADGSAARAQCCAESTGGGSGDRVPSPDAAPP